MASGVAFPKCIATKICIEAAHNPELLNVKMYVWPALHISSHILLGGQVARL